MTYLFFANYVRVLQYLPKPPRIAANEWKKYVKIFNVQNAYMDFESISESVNRTGLILFLKDNKDLITYVTQNSSNWFFVNLQQELPRPVGIYQHWMNACRNCLNSKPSSWLSCLQTGLFTNLCIPFLWQQIMCMSTCACTEFLFCKTIHNIKCAL